MKKYLSLMAIGIFLTGCINQYDYSRVIRFFDGVSTKDKVSYYKILDSQMFFETKLLGIVQDFNGEKLVAINEKDEQVGHKSFENKILRIYRYKEEDGKNPSFIVETISSDNGICKDFSTGLPISRKTTLNVYRPNGDIGFVMRDGYTFSKNTSEKFSGNYTQLGFETFSDEDTERMQKDFIDSFRQFIKKECLNK